MEDIVDKLDEIVERFEKAIEDLTSYKNEYTARFKAEEAEHKRWRAEKGEEYFYVNYAGGIYEDEETLSKDDNNIFEIGNYFKTREQAEQRLEHIKIEQQLKDIALRLNKGVEIEWGWFEGLKYYLQVAGNKIMSNNVYSEKTQGTIYCLDENFKDTAIEEIGEDRLKNYLKEA